MHNTMLYTLELDEHHLSKIHCILFFILYIVRTSSTMAPCVQICKLPQTGKLHDQGEPVYFMDLLARYKPCVRLG
jgi:hypothetical protein